MERYEYMFLILKPIKVTFKTYGNYIHFTLKPKKKKKNLHSFYKNYGNYAYFNHGKLQACLVAVFKYYCSVFNIVEICV